MNLVVGSTAVPEITTFLKYRSSNPENRVGWRFFKESQDLGYYETALDGIAPIASQELSLKFEHGGKWIKMNPKGKPKVNLLNFQDYKGRVRIYGVKNSDWVLSSKEPLTRLKVPPSSAGIGALYVQAGKLRLLDDSVAVDLPILAEPAKETIVTLMPNNLVLEETKSRKRPREELAECLQKNISRKKHCPDRYYPEKKSKKKLDELPLQGPLTRKEDNKIKRRVVKEKKFWHIM